jgi:hypothetical protein
MNCSGVSNGSNNPDNPGVAAFYIANDCYGFSAGSDAGVTSYIAIGCYGVCTLGDTVDATIKSNCN